MTKLGTVLSQNSVFLIFKVVSHWIPTTYVLRGGRRGRNPLITNDLQHRILKNYKIKNPHPCGWGLYVMRELGSQERAGFREKNLPNKELIRLPLRVLSKYFSTSALFAKRMWRVETALWFLPWNSVTTRDELKVLEITRSGRFFFSL